jgi:hypothetical protein
LAAIAAIPTSDDLHAPMGAHEFAGQVVSGGMCGKHNRIFLQAVIATQKCVTK